MAKRIAQSSVNWSALAERVPPAQKGNLAVFKAKSDSYLRRVLANPEEAPKIDWAYYKKTVPIPGMVDTFQKQYESLKIPFPADNYTAQVEAQGKELKAAIEKFVQESQARIAEYEKSAAEVKALMPYSEMTMEDFRDAHPEFSLDPINNPTYWPHNPEEQLGYVDKDKPASSH